jgi:hypothetical protein
MAVPKSILFFPGTFNIPYFIETDITNFFTNYGDMCEDYNIKKKNVFVVILGTVLSILLLL